MLFWVLPSSGSRIFLDNILVCTHQLQNEGLVLGVMPYRPTASNLKVMLHEITVVDAVTS